MNKSFDERWGIKDDTARKKRAHNVLLNFIEKLREPTPNEEAIYYSILGERVPGGTGWHRVGGPAFQVAQLESFVKNTVEFARRLEALLRAVDWGDRKEFLQKRVNENSQLFGFVVIRDSEADMWETYPAGSDLYDGDLVVEVAQSLGPKSKREFMDALKLYKEGKEALAVGKSRRTIEELLREILSNTKGLSSNMQGLKTWLTGKSIDTKIAEYICAFVALIDKRYNDLEKHNSVTHDERSAEYFIYQAGVIARYILRIRNERS